MLHFHTMYRYLQYLLGSSLYWLPLFVITVCYTIYDMRRIRYSWGILFLFIGHYIVSDPAHLIQKFYWLLLGCLLICLGFLCILGKNFFAAWYQQLSRVSNALGSFIYPCVGFIQMLFQTTCLKIKRAFFRLHKDYQIHAIDEIDLLLHSIIQEQLAPLQDERPLPNLRETKKSVSCEQERKLEYSYTLPSLHILPKPQAHKTAAKNELALRKKQLEEKLTSCGVDGKVTKIHVGPVLTLFEFSPAPHCKISKITGLEDDLALAMQALSVRIIAPVPGTAVVGFEVVYKEREMVFFYDVVEHVHDFSFRLPLAVGKDSLGNPCIVDLVSLPHLLVAGTTGSGKSVCLQTLVTSLLMTKSPQEVRLILIDPKRLEFTHYQAVPHLLFPIVVVPQQSVQVLQWVIQTMEERYALLAQAGVRSCEEYQAQGEVMPYIVIVIDELADLMMVTHYAVEEYIARIAQMARAAGIHMIIATQRPSADVITGLIKVNFPARIACKVASKVDSRVILDAPGAEKLIGKGDMLFLQGNGTIMRAHGAFITTLEIHKVVEHCRLQQQPQYHDLASLKTGPIASANDPLLDEIIRYVEGQQEISISALQRVFRIGYNRSARIMVELESRGIIDPNVQGKMRKIVSRP